MEFGAKTGCHSAAKPQPNDKFLLWVLGGRGGKGLGTKMLDGIWREMAGNQGFQAGRGGIYRGGEGTQKGRLDRINRIQGE